MRTVHSSKMLIELCEIQVLIPVFYHPSWNIEYRNKVSKHHCISGGSCMYLASLLPGIF